MTRTSSRTASAQTLGLPKAKPKKRTAPVAPADLLASLYELPDPTPNPYAPCPKQYPNSFVAFRTHFNSVVVARDLPAATGFQGLISGEAGRRWRLIKNTPVEDEWAQYAARSQWECAPNPDSRANKRRRARKGEFVQYDATRASRPRKARRASGETPSTPAPRRSRGDIASMTPPSSSSSSPSPRDVSFSPLQSPTSELPSAFGNATTANFSPSGFASPPVGQFMNVSPAPYYGALPTFESSPLLVEESRGLDGDQSYVDLTFGYALSPDFWASSSYDSSPTMFQYVEPLWASADTQSYSFDATY